MSFLSLGNSSFSDPYNPTEAVLNSRIGETEKWGNAKENEDKLRGFSFALDKQKKIDKALAKAESYIGGQNKIAGVANVLGSVGGFAAGGGFGGGDAFKGLGGFGPVADGQAYGGFLDATAGTSGMGPLSNGDIYGSFLDRR